MIEAPTIDVGHFPLAAGNTPTKAPLMNCRWPNPASRRRSPAAPRWRSRNAGAGVTAVIAAALALTIAAPSHPAPTSPRLLLHTVALSGERPPGPPPVGDFHTFTTPAIDSAGNVAFVASLGPEGDVSSVWLNAASHLRALAVAGQPAPTTGARFAEFSDVVLPGGGIAAFKASLAGAVIGDDNRDSIWLDRSGSLALVTQAGREAPSAGGELRFSHFETPLAASPDGHVAFFARTRDKELGPAEGSGIWTAAPSGASLAAHDGAAAIPGEPNTVFLPQSFEQPFSNNPVMSPTGQTVFRGFLAGPGIDETNLNGLWSYRPGAALESLVRAGDEAVGMGGVPFVSFPSVPTVNAAGDTAFLAFFGRHQHPPGDSGSQAPAMTDPHQHDHDIPLGMWLRKRSGELDHIFTIGDHAPGIAGDVRLVDTFDPIMNAAGRVAFLAAAHGEGVDDSNQMGLWSNAASPDGSLRLVARQGDGAPGMESGFVFGTFLEPSLNASGQAAFMASGFRQAEGVVLDSAFGIWAQDRAGRLQLIASVGQVIQIAPGDEREIASLSFTSKSGGEDGRPRGFNDRGQIVFHATFADGTSGIFVSNALVVPEPRSTVVWLLAATCCGLGGAWWRRTRPSRPTTFIH
jgi:hypothetical protein